MFKLLQKLFSKKEKKENEEMAEEKNVNEKVETEKVETEEKAKVDEKPTEKTGDKVEETAKTEEKKVEDTEEDKKEEPAAPVEEEKEVVEEVEPVGNGLRIEDIVTKEDLAEKFAAFEAKFEALIKENNDLKNEVSRLQEKYEDNDFGSMSKQGMIQKDKDANSSFDEYSKNFM